MTHQDIAIGDYCPQWRLVGGFGSNENDGDKNPLAQRFYTGPHLLWGQGATPCPLRFNEDVCRQECSQAFSKGWLRSSHNDEELLGLPFATGNPYRVSCEAEDGNQI